MISFVHFKGVILIVMYSDEGYLSSIEIEVNECPIYVRTACGFHGTI